MGILFLLKIALVLAEILILARCVISWVPPWQRAPWGRVVTALTEPMLFPLRRAMRVNAGAIGIDFSPMILLFIIHGVRQLLGL